MKIFFTKRKKIKIKTENTAIGATLEKEKNVTEFLQRTQTIKYKGYNYSINKNEDYFKRKNELIMTILNSEDAAIKKCD